LAAHADLLPVVVDPVADPGGLPARLAHELHVRDVDEQLALDDAGLLELLAAARALAAHPRVALRAGHALDHDPPLAGEHVDHAARPAAVLAVHHLDLVVLADINARHHSTSGASEMIFMNRFSRSSRATGPKMRVPRGFFCSL